MVRYVLVMLVIYIYIERYRGVCRNSDVGGNVTLGGFYFFILFFVFKYILIVILM